MLKERDARGKRCKVSAQGECENKTLLLDTAGQRAGLWGNAPLLYNHMHSRRTRFACFLGGQIPLVALLGSDWIDQGHASAHFLQSDPEETLIERQKAELEQNPVIGGERRVRDGTVSDCQCHSMVINANTSQSVRTVLVIDHQWHHTCR